ncbi:MAG: hypothetical protein MI924_18050 [Chloroflexales bacterium]|nr:hypothetical protein [Chloroflexales bacterium]
MPARYYGLAGGPPLEIPNDHLLPDRMYPTIPPRSSRSTIGGSLVATIILTGIGQQNQLRPEFRRRLA